MANQKPTPPTTDTEIVQVTEPATRTYDPRKKVRVYNTVTGAKLPNPVPETWLDGRFPQLSETPSLKKAGK